MARRPYASRVDGRQHGFLEAPVLRAQVPEGLPPALHPAVGQRTELPRRDDRQEVTRRLLRRPLPGQGASQLRALNTRHSERRKALPAPPGCPTHHLGARLLRGADLQQRPLPRAADALLRPRSSALVAAWRGQPARRSYPDRGLVGTPSDRDSPCAAADEEAAPCRGTSRNVVRRQTAAHGAEPNTHSKGSR